MMTRIEIPTLTTPRLILRALRADDLDAFAAMNANPEVTRYLGSGQTLTRAQTWDLMARMLGQWALRGYGFFAVVEAASGRFIGRSGVLHPLSWTEPELAYGLDQPYWGKGYATESTITLRDWAFATLGVTRIASYIRPDNAASAAVLRRMGAVRTGMITLLGGDAERWEHQADGTVASAGA
jgi:RimJ/RimL family protein N-acetyltransferase